MGPEDRPQGRDDLALGRVGPDRGDQRRHQVAGRLGGAEHLAKEIEQFVGWYAASPPVAGLDHVKVAGEPERERKAERLAGGIPVDSVTWDEIVAAGAKVGIERAELNRLAGA